MESDIGTDKIRTLYLERKAQIEQSLRDDRARLQQVQLRLKLLDRQAAYWMPDIVIKRVPAQPVLSYRYFCFVAPSPDRVALGFEYGVLLTNDTGLLEGDGTQVRYVTLRRAEDIREPELAALIAEAAMVAATFKRW
jgi:hypothetical protein